MPRRSNAPESSRTIRAWTTTDYEADAFAWIRDNTPPSTRCVVPIDRQDAFAIAERPIVGNWQAIRYDALALWKQRVDALVGGPEISRDPPGPVDELTARRAAYDRLSGPQISAVARRYAANCIVSTTRYSFPIWHQIDDVRIYRVNDRATRSAAP